MVASSTPPRLRPRSLLALVVSLLVTVGIVVPLSTTSAQAAVEVLASENPLNYTPRVLDGQVSAVVRIGDTVVVGGTFTQIQEASDTAPVLDQHALFAFDARTGAIDPDFMPDVRAGDPSNPVRVNALVPAADGTSVYVGGSFRTINGVGPTRVQRLSLATGTKVTSFKNKNINSEVFDLALSGGRLYVAGSFSTVGGVNRSRMASLNATTGALTEAFTLPFSGVNNGGSTTVKKIAITPAGDRLVAIGNFTSVAGQPRSQIAMFDTSGATATVASWYTTRFPNECARAFDTYMRDVSISDDGSFFVVVTTGAWGGTARLCDSATRWETYRNGQQLQPSWIAYTGGDTFWAVEVVGSVAYVGGHFRWLNNSYPPRGDAAGPGAVTREGLAALDVRNGLPLSWDPGRERGVGVFDFYMTPTELWAGSDTDTWANEYRPRIAGFPLASGLPIPEDRTGSLPSDVVLLDSQSVSGNDTQVRYFDGSVVTDTSSLGGAPDWSTARGAVMIDGYVYVGQSDGTFVKRTFDGTSFGPAADVPLGGIGWVNEMSRVTSMFYDRELGRLYYTLRKSSPNATDGGLYYRWFTPESGVVGTVRWDPGQAAAAVIDPSNVAGAFLSGGFLYFVDANGAMKRIAYSGGAFTGSATVVNNAVDWRASGLFLATGSTVIGPNADPSATFTSTCAGLSCTFDATASSDPDGAITSFEWSFSDGSPNQEGESVSTTFAAADTYTVTLTVTDNRGGVGVESRQVTVAPLDSPIAARVFGEYVGGSTRNHTYALPGSVQAGDTMVLFVTGSLATDIAAPAGWTQVGEQLDVSTRTIILTRTAVSQDAGASVTISWFDPATSSPTATRTVMAFAAYEGVSSVAVTTVPETSATNVTSHTTPGATVPDPASWVLSYWSDRNTSTTGWTPPPGQAVRADPAPTGLADGTVRVTGLLTDSGGQALPGSWSGKTATANAAAKHATMATVVLAPQ